MKNILVTGGAGFIGRHLVRALLKEGHRVHVVDDFSTGDREAFTELLIEHHTQLSFDEMDVCSTEKDVCSTEKNDWYFGYVFDEIYHLACPASPVAYQANPLKTIQTCYQGTLAVLKLAQADGARVLIASTSEVYGDPLEHPQCEHYQGNVSTTGPRACYDEGKRVAETLASLFAKGAGVSVKIARIFNTYGPGMMVQDGRVVSEFITRLLLEKSISVHGGNQTRSFCYVDDMVRGLIALMASPGNEPVNLGNPAEEITMTDLLMLLADELEIVPLVKFGVRRVDDPFTRQPDILRARLLLDWEPRVRLIEGLRLTISDFRERLRIEEKSREKVVANSGISS